MAQKKRAFTLIELLIVVAIIAILAAIAVPNFLEAQTRSKVARMRADMRSVATAIEAYRLDYNNYPLSGVDAPYGNSFALAEIDHTVFYQLTTPISYMTSYPIDIFVREDFTAGDDTRKFVDYRRTLRVPAPGGGSTIDDVASGSAFPNNATETPTSWILFSAGPDRAYDLTAFGRGFGDPLSDWALYDPTNGTVSVGDIVRAREAPTESDLYNL